MSTALNVKDEALRLTSDKECKLAFSDAIRAWTGGKLSARSSYYAGRGPNSCDLNSGHLEMLWTGIQKDVGDEAARNFVLMVENLSDMSASAFLVSFEHYFFDKFRWRDRKQKRMDNYEISGQGDNAHFEATAVVYGALARRGVDAGEDASASISIKSDFLRNHSATWSDPSSSRKYNPFLHRYG